MNVNITEQILPSSEGQKKAETIFALSCGDTKHLLVASEMQSRFFLTSEGQKH